MLALGQYPEVSLELARDGRDEARRQLADGIDPTLQKLEVKRETQDTFAAVAAEWLELQRKTFAEKTFEKAQWTFNDLINPYLGTRPIASITARGVLAVVRHREQK